MIRTKKELLLSELVRDGYGPQYTWDSTSNTLALRKGVGRIEDGPTIPKVRIPTGEVTNEVHKKVDTPAAIALTSVKPVDVGFSDDLTGANVNTNASQSAKARVKAYIAANS